MKNSFILIIISIIIGVYLGWYSNVYLNKSNLKKVEVKSKINQNDFSKNEFKLLDLDLKELNFECSKNIVSINPLIVKYAENAICNCDSAKTNLEINFCSGVELCIEKNRFDILNKKILKVYDSLIVIQNEEIIIAKKTNDSFALEGITDYKSIKEFHKKSIKLYLEYTETEKQIQGIEIGMGRERVACENDRSLEILKMKNIELTKLIKEYY